MPLSTELASAVRAQLDRAARGLFHSPEMAALRPILELQVRWSMISGADDLLIEKCVSRDGHHLFVFFFERHLVNGGIGALLACRLSRSIPLTLFIAVNDYGLELLSDRKIPAEVFADLSILNTDRLMEDVLASVNAAERGRRQFREIARVAGLVFQGYPGRRRSNSPRYRPPAPCPAMYCNTASRRICSWSNPCVKSWNGSSNLPVFPDA